LVGFINTVRKLKRILAYCIFIQYCYFGDIFRFDVFPPRYFGENADFSEKYVSLRATELVADCSGIACGI